MLYKSNDIHLILDEGFKPQFIADEMNLFFYYVLNRHDIQMKKESGEPSPWTDNKILQSNSFTCNRRVDDKTTKWLLQHITNNPELDYKDKFWRSLLFRLYNRIDTAELIDLGSKDFWNNDNVHNVISKLESLDSSPYTRAYKTIGYVNACAKEYPNYKSRCYKRIFDLRFINKGEVPQECLKTAKDAFNWLKQLDGIGDFTGFQLLIDLMYIPEIPYSNNCFVVLGPGAVSGVSRICKNPDWRLYHDTLVYIQQNFEELCQKYYDPNFDYDTIKFDLKDFNAYCVTDVQNLFCEFSKFRYLMEGKHKKPRKYIIYGGI